MVDLGHNQIETIPSEIEHLVNLEDYLYLHNNKLETVPPEIKTLKN